MVPHGVGGTRVGGGSVTIKGGRRNGDTAKGREAAQGGAEISLQETDRVIPQQLDGRQLLFLLLLT